MSVALILFSFGTDKGIFSNTAIRRRGLEFASRFPGVVHMYCQEETMPARGEVVDYYPNRENLATLESFTSPTGNYITTADFAKWAIARASAEKVTEVYFVAAKPHEARCCAELTRLIDADHKSSGYQWDVSALAPTAVRTDYNFEDWFCKDSRQWWTRSKFLWDLREFFVALVLKYRSV